MDELLEAFYRGGGFMESQTDEPSPFAPISEGPGSVIGRYKLLQKIGEGGFGVVYMAEQRKPIVRKVALKIIKLGMDTKQVVGRFEAERQALAMMDHPNIAKILDAGSTDSGRPFFCMELVRGIPITEFCDQNSLTTQERLELFEQVCCAVHHAHQKGIIHRDIKPSNILVTMHDDVPVPKVIDFGIAKATQAILTEKTIFTRFNQFFGTPAYTSPEQAGLCGLDIDTRSDVYSLGVLLYEMLTGRTPFDSGNLMKKGFEEICRIIREEDPPKPSTRLSGLNQEDLKTVALSYRSQPEKLTRLIRGELDWIVMKSLEKQRTRRYESASAFAQDIHNYLHHEPVSAAAASLTYQFMKLARRHRTVFGLAATIVILLATVTIVSIKQGIRIE